MVVVDGAVVEDDVVGIAKTVTDNYDDEELRDTLINISLDLYETMPLRYGFNASTDNSISFN